MLQCECLDCHESFATDAPATFHGFEGFWQFLLTHRLCVRMYRCPDGSKFVARIGTKPLRIGE